MSAQARLDSALTRLRDAVERAAIEPHGAGESDRQADADAASDLQSLQAAYDALRAEHDRLLAQRDADLTHNGGEASEHAARLLRELSAARNAHQDLERAYDALQQDLVALRGGGHAHDRTDDESAAAIAQARAELARLQEQRAQVARDLDAERAELSRLAAIRDEVARRLENVIAQLEALSGHRAGG
ncbi:MAG: hypothetical protein Tsb0016_12980 [Sphingomonadales bacterium]